MEHLALINNTIRVKESNTQLVLAALKRFGSATRNEIARSTGLSLSTCGNILKTLLTSGEILEGGVQSHSGGRPAQKYTYNKTRHLVASIAIVPQKSSYTVHYTIANLYKEKIAQNTFSREELHFISLESFLAMICKKFPTLKAIGIGLPSLLFHKFLKETSATQGTALSLLLSQKFNLKVQIEKSSAMIAIGHLKKHPYLAEKTIAAIIPSQDFVSAGYVFNGHIYRGSSCREGDFAFLPPKTLPIGASSQSPANQKTIFAIAASIATFQAEVILLPESETFSLPLPELKRICSKIFPHKIQPEFIMIEDILDTYISGALDTAISSLQPNLTLVIN